jgi:hypothetical protein
VNVPIRSRDDEFEKGPNSREFSRIGEFRIENARGRETTPNPDEKIFRTGRAKIR